MDAMKRPRPWLHFLLTIALVFNGVIAAHAATAMSLRHASTAAGLHAANQPTPSAAAPTVAPCHEASTPAQPAATVDPVAVHPSGADMGSDCCDSGACNCECVHPSQATPAMAFVAGAALLHADNPGALAPAHAEAVLPHLIRPPIV